MFMIDLFRRASSRFPLDERVGYLLLFGFSFVRCFSYKVQPSLNQKSRRYCFARRFYHRFHLRQTLLELTADHFFHVHVSESQVATYDDVEVPPFCPEGG